LLLKLSSHLLCHSVAKQRQTEQGFIFTFVVSTADSQMPAVGKLLVTKSSSLSHAFRE
jgi:hypothetical protein